MRKSSLFLLLFLCLHLAHAQESKHETVLSAPDTWRPEIINMPLGFAPSITYKGFEDIRFAPGWSDTTASDYFTYTFVWVLDKAPKLDQMQFESHMRAYFDGLMTAVSGRDDLPKTQASFRFAKAKKDFGAVGQITFYEAFFKKSVITLHVTAEGRHCPEQKKHLVWFRLSPQDQKDPLWKKFDEVQLKIDCDK